MGQEFKASVQYDDWKGTAAADSADAVDFGKHLKAKGLLSSEEFLLGIDVWVGENHGGNVTTAHVTALASKHGSHDETAREIQRNGYAKVKKIEIEMPIEEFMRYFKRFSIAISAHGMLEMYEAED